MTTLPPNAEQIREDFYAIALTLPRSGQVFFKADRYSPYSGRLQTTYRVQEAQRFKTPKGVLAAIERLVAKGTIKPDQQATAIRYVETVVKRYTLAQNY